MHLSSLSSTTLATNKSFSLDNDYYQQQIYMEVKRNNSSNEIWRHFLAIFSTLIGILMSQYLLIIYQNWELIYSLNYNKGVFGIFGNFVSLFILLKPSRLTSLSRFTANKTYRLNRKASTYGSFDQKLTSFYTYLTALSFCDFFSCIFAILNMLEHLPPPYLESYSMAYRDLCMSLSIFTNPIANTLQALSVWIIVAFSIHRCRLITLYQSINCISDYFVFWWFTSKLTGQL
jgi:hypothetical protein